MRDAGRLQPRLAGLSFAKVYSSPLQRALATAAVAGFPEAVPTPDLREFDYGDYEGLASDQIQVLSPGWSVYKDGCPGGETPAQVYERARRFLAEAMGGTGPEDNVLAFSHGHLIRALAVAFLDLDVRQAGLLGLDTASITVLRDGGKGRLLQVWNSRP